MQLMHAPAARHLPERFQMECKSPQAKKGQDSKWPIREKLKNIPARIHGPASALTGRWNRMVLVFPTQEICVLDDRH